MGFYTSWGRQAAFTERECPAPDVYVDAAGLRFVARCRPCGWRTRLVELEAEAFELAEVHAGRRPRGLESILDVRQVRKGLGLERWPTRAPKWAKLLIGLPTDALDDLSTVPGLVQAALNGDVVEAFDPLPVDPGDASLAGLHTGWAAGTTGRELGLVEHWVLEPPRPRSLPLRPSYAPDLYQFLLERVKLEFPYLDGQRYALVPSGLLQDAGFVAVQEQRRRTHKPQPARRQIELLVLGLRAKYGANVTGPATS